MATAKSGIGKPRINGYSTAYNAEPRLTACEEYSPEHNLAFRSTRWTLFVELDGETFRLRNENTGETWSMLVSRETINSYVWEHLSQTVAIEFSRRCGINHEVLGRQLRGLNGKTLRVVRFETSERIPAFQSESVDSQIQWGTSYEARPLYPDPEAQLTAEQVRRFRDAMMESVFRIPEEYIHETFGFVADDSKRKEAEKRAEELLVEHLSDRQKADWQHYKAFDCVGSKTGLTYRISNFRQGNANRSDGNKYCIVQSSDTPLNDQLLTEKMLIENDEEKFLSVANNLTQRTNRPSFLDERPLILSEQQYISMRNRFNGV